MGFDEEWDSVSSGEDSSFDTDWDSAPDVKSSAAIPAAIERPSWGESAKFVGKSLASGVAKNFDLASSIYGLTNPVGLAETAVRKVFNAPKPSLKEFTDQYIGDPKEMGITGTAAELAQAASEGATFPLGGPVANAVTSVGGEVAHKIFPDNPYASLMGSLFTAGGLGAAGKVASLAKGAGNAFERASIGAGASDYTRSLKKSGLIGDEETGELGTRLSRAINEIGETEGFGLLRDPARLAKRNKEALQEFGSKIGERTQAADALGATPVIGLLDEGSATQKLIGKAKAEKADLKEALNEFLERFTDPKDGWDGTVQGLNSWKSSIGEMAFSGSAKGPQSANVIRKLQRAIRTDLEKGVDDAVVGSGAAKPEEWHGLQRVYSNHKEIEPVLNHEVAKDLSGSWDKLTRGLLRTSGGTLTTPTLIGGALAGAAGGAPLGLAAGAALGLLGTPTGRGIAANVLKTTGNIGKVATKDAVISPLANVARDGGSGLGEMMKGLFSSSPAKASVKENIFDTPLEEALKTDVRPRSKVISEVFSKKNMPTDPKELPKIEKEIDSDPFDSAVYEMESGRNPNAKNPKSSASGGFQLLKGTAKTLGVKDVFDLKQNYEGFKKLKSEHKERFGDNPELLYAAHYLGSTVLNKALKGLPLKDSEQKQVEEFKEKILPRFQKIYAKRAIDTEIV